MATVSAAATAKKIITNVEKVIIGKRQELILAVLKGDERFSGFLITYRNEPELVVNTTVDAASLVEKIDGMKPGGGAALRM